MHASAPISLFRICKFQVDENNFLFDEKNSRFDSHREFCRKPSEISGVCSRASGRDPVEFTIFPVLFPGRREPVETGSMGAASTRRRSQPKKINNQFLSQLSVDSVAEGAQQQLELAAAS